MLTQLQTLQNRIPEPARRFWRNYNGWIILLLSTGLMWATNGRTLVTDYFDDIARFSKNPADGQRIANSPLYSFGIWLGYTATAARNHPERILPWIGLFWSVAVLHYRYLFKPYATRSWRYVLVYVFTLAVSFYVDNGMLTFWALSNKYQGKDTINYWLVGFCIVYAFWNHFRETREARRALTEQATQAELAALKAQINPHFLFNSLNNIFGTALTEGGQRTPDGVQQLSRLMRYQLEQTSADHVDLQTEMNFLDEYVQFHHQLLPNATALTHQYEWDEQPVTIAPLLLTPLVDYALQHRQASSNAPIRSELSVQKQFLHYQLTYPASTNVPDNDILANVKQRLTKLYPYFTLKETSVNQINTLDLTINLPN